MRRAPGGHLQDVAPGSAHHPPSHELDAGEELVPLDLLVEPIGEAVVRLASHRLVHDGAARGDAGAVADRATIDDAPAFPAVAVRAGPGRGAQHRAVSHRGAHERGGGAAERAGGAEDEAHRARASDAPRTEAGVQRRRLLDDDAEISARRARSRLRAATFSEGPTTNRNVLRRSTETGGARARRRTERGRRPRLRRVSRFPRGVRVASTSSRGVGANDGEDNVGLSGRVRGGSARDAVDKGAEGRLRRATDEGSLGDSMRVRARRDPRAGRARGVRRGEPPAAGSSPRG